jgi:hypothetical protein
VQPQCLATPERGREHESVQRLQWRLGDVRRVCTAGVDPGPFVLDEWLDRLPPTFEVRPGWSTAVDHKRHRNARAYVLWLGARRRKESLT